MMVKYFPFADDNKTRSGERITIMSHLVDKMNMQSEMLKRQILSAQQKNETGEGAFDVKLKCLEIAFSIERGDSVPLEDLLFLKSRDPELYAHAINMGQQNAGLPW